MKKLLFLLAFGISAKAGFSQATTTVTTKQETKAEQLAVATFDSQTFDFGKIKQGVPVTHKFEIKNTGTVPLLITNVVASCGCTTPAWTGEPISPGETGSITATFNAASLGVFNKTVTATANVEGLRFQLTIRGEVVAEVK